MIGNQLNNEKYVVVATKIPLWMATQLNTICEVLGTNSYDLIQTFLYGFICHATHSHDVSPEMTRLLMLLKMDAGWQQAFNLANPAQLDVAQAILILQQKDRKGFGTIMIDKPFFDGATTQTENIDDILERIIEVTQTGTYKQIRELGAKMGCQRFCDIITRMLDEQTNIHLAEEFQQEMPGMGDRADNGRTYAYGRKFKRKQHFTPDSARHPRIAFDTDDQNIATMEAEGWEGEYQEREPIDGAKVEQALGCRPFTEES